jgi:hypothetical protein
MYVERDESSAMSGVRNPKLTEQTEPFAVVLGAPTPELQSLWFATQARPWNSLVVLAASPGGPALEVAQALYDVGARASGLPLKLVDGRNVSLASSTSLTANMLALQQPTPGRSAGRVLVVLQSVLSEPAGIPVARAADAVLLCVELGKTPLEDARRTLALAGGPEKVLGCVGVPSR